MPLVRCLLLACYFMFGRNCERRCETLGGVVATVKDVGNLVLSGSLGSGSAYL